MDHDHVFGELVHEYVAECLPHADAVTDALLDLERRWRAGDTDPGDLTALKARLHTVKGNSAMMGLRPMQTVAHALEDLCARVLADPAWRTPETAGLLVQGAGLLADLIRSAAEPGADGEAAEAYVTRVRAALGATPRSESPLRLERRRGDRRAGPEAGGGTIRVDFQRLDTLLEIFGEAMIAQSALPDAHRRLRAILGNCDETAELEQVVTVLGATMKRLEAALMQTRLLPISTVFGRFNRLVRDVARGEGKQVRLVTDGGDTLLDKTILDRLGEPLVHLLTNAVVHGVEAEAERRHCGKPAEATLALHAAAVADRIVVTVTDDGRGLDTERILAKARALDLEVRSTEPEDVHALIFVPGFSTADDVSELAGRGVGLDAAAAAIHALGGAIDVRSEEGTGTVFTLTLPLTLAIVRSLIVEVDRERYAVPLSHVAETTRVDPAALHELQGQGVMVWRGAAMHVADGGAILGTGGASRAPRNYCVVLFAGPRRRGVLVDRLIGHQDVVVKSLDPTLGRPQLVSGTTILGDGRVACILDAAGVVSCREAA
ncbi:MAG TPA: chemotaxis protein CheW [Gemmatimonadales bacterium]|nr:chemotaxis protein CheW [Gemmatimonadales bacterium]